jgi:BirA family biotin operon repressor/biotin-[acetyl-CoA-carboxylase] ligase
VTTNVRAPDTELSLASLSARLKACSPAAAERFPSFLHLDVADSTNERLLNLPPADRRDGLVASAQVQTSGRGRLGRTWVSPQGNLHLSFLRRIVEPIERAGIVSLLAGIALCRALRRVSEIPACVKWPNDVMAGDRKVAGILLEARDGWQVVGVGVNVTTTRADLGPELRETATTLLDEGGQRVPPVAVAAEFLSEFHPLEQAFLRSFSLPVAEYLALFPWIGAEVTVAAPGDRRESGGRISGVAEDGALLLTSARGEEIRVTSGEVLHVRKRR